MSAMEKAIEAETRERTRRVQEETRREREIILSFLVNGGYTEMTLLHSPSPYHRDVRWPL